MPNFTFIGNATAVQSGYGQANDAGFVALQAKALAPNSASEMRMAHAVAEATAAAAAAAQAAASAASKCTITVQRPESRRKPFPGNPDV